MFKEIINYTINDYLGVEQSEFNRERIISKINEENPSIDDTNEAFEQTRGFYHPNRKVINCHNLGQLLVQPTVISLLTTIPEAVPQPLFKLNCFWLRYNFFKSSYI